MKQSPYWRHTNIRYRRTKCSRHGTFEAGTGATPALNTRRSTHVSRNFTHSSPRNYEDGADLHVPAAIPPYPAGWATQPVWTRRTDKYLAAVCPAPNRIPTQTDLAQLSHAARCVPKWHSTNYQYRVSLTPRLIDTKLAAGRYNLPIMRSFKLLREFSTLSLDHRCCCFLGISYPEDGGSSFIWNMSTLLTYLLRGAESFLRS